MSENITSSPCEVPCNSWKHYWKFAGVLSIISSGVPSNVTELAKDNLRSLEAVFLSANPTEQMQAVKSLESEEDPEVLLTCLYTVEKLWDKNPEAALSILSLASIHPSRSVRRETCNLALMLANEGEGLDSLHEKQHVTEEQRQELSGVIAAVIDPLLLD